MIIKKIKGEYYIMEYKCKYCNSENLFTENMEIIQGYIVLTVGNINSG